MSAYLENFDVSDNFLNQVLESLGYPLVDKETLNEIFEFVYKNNESPLGAFIKSKLC